jgi:hypothetical protein
LKAIFVSNDDLRSNLKLKAAYYQAKCKYYMKLGIASKMQANVAKLLKCHDELKIMTSQKISAYNYKITSEMKSMRNQKKTMLEFLNAIRSELSDNQA